MKRSGAWEKPIDGWVGRRERLDQSGYVRMGDVWPDIPRIFVRRQAGEFDLLIACISTPTFDVGAPRLLSAGRSAL